MKKLISLIASLSLMATMVAPAFAADLANNAPVTETVITEITAEEFESDWVGEPLPEGQTAYLVEVTATGLDLSSVRAGSTAAAKKKRTGVLLMLAEYELMFDSTDNVAAVYGVDGIATFTTEEKKAYAIAMYSDAPSAYPQTTDAATTAVTAEDAYVTAFVVTTTGTVTGDVVATYKITSFDSNTGTGTQNYKDDLGNVSYTVNGEATNEVTLGTVVPDPEPDPDPDPVEEFEYRAKKDLKDTDGETVIGYAWDLTINGFDSTKTYTATFTAGGETKTNELFLDGAEVKNGSIAFAALLKTAKTAVELVLAKN